MEEEQFISGIYNYCDRWCERCAFTHRCRVHHDEQAMLERHLLRGEDPDDPEVQMQDVQENLRRTLELLLKMAEEMGVDLEEGADEEPRLFEMEEDALCRRAMAWEERVERLLARVTDDLPEVAEGLQRRAERGELDNPEETLAALKHVCDGLELLGRYRFLIPVKLARAGGSMDEAEAREDPMLAGFARDDALGTARLVHECLGKCADALWRMVEFHRPWMNAALACVTEAEALRREVDERFPGHAAYRRPGLDDVA